jgi:hypothetical protein
MREEKMQTWFTDDEDQLMSTSGDHLLHSSLDKMTNSTYDTYNDLEMFDGFSESTPSTGHFSQSKQVSEDTNRIDIEFKERSEAPSRLPTMISVETAVISPRDIPTASILTVSTESNDISALQGEAEAEQTVFKQSPSVDVTAGFDLGRSNKSDNFQKHR